MCGIAGFVSDITEELAHSVCNAMGRSLSHRGPDHLGIHVTRLSPHLSLGFSHTLLRIIGREGEGIQPFSVDGGTLLFNGAIYNYATLRDELKASCQFKTETDTEVLAHGLAREGIHFLKRARGMFAFAFWNSKKRVLWFGRDPFGVKPLYYTRLARGVAFASEYKAILPHLSRGRIDHAAVNDYLRLRYVPGTATLIQEIRKVKPGTVMEYDPERNEMEEVHYFSLRVESNVPDKDHLFDLIEQATSRRAVADVEVAALLSGGIDSGLVSDLLSRSVKSLKTYTLSFPGLPIDESESAASISRLIDGRNTRIDAVEASIDTLARLAYHLDDPYGDPIILALDRIFSSIHGKQRVVVTGEGADEIFSGYVHHRLMGISDRIPRALLPLLPSICRGVPFSILAKLFPYAAKLNREDYHKARDRFVRFVEKGSLKSFQAIFFLFDDEELRDGSATYLTSDQGRASLESLRAWDFQNWLPDSQLFKLDKISMASSIEAREPFVDVDLIGGVAAIPARQHIRLRSDKPVLRKSVCGRLRIPPEVVTRRKSSFFQPLGGSNLSGLRAQLKERIAASKGFLSEFMEPGVLDECLSEGQGLLDEKKIFALGMLTLWGETIHGLSGTGARLDAT